MAALPAQRPDLLFCPFFHGNKLHPAPGNKRHPLEVNHRLREELRTTALKEHISRKHPACIRMPLSQIFLHSFVRKQERIFKSRRWQMPFAGVLHPLLPPRFTGERVPAHLKRPFLLQHNKYYVVEKLGSSESPFPGSFPWQNHSRHMLFSLIIFLRDMEMRWDNGT